MLSISDDIVKEIKKYSRFSSVEFIIGTKCQNACSYCYRVNCQNDGPILPVSNERIKLYLKNAQEMGLVERPKSIEFFGGDPLINIDALNGWVDTLKYETDCISIPTNGRILESIPETLIQEMIDNAKPSRLFFSLSVDGLLEKENRPLSEFGRMQGFSSDRDWSKLFDIAKKFNMGFHPMLTFSTSHRWFDMWLHLYENASNVYLLEVRHGTGDPSSLVDGVISIGKIINYCHANNIKNTFNATEMNTTLRGLPCAALMNMTINTDGKVYFCHRLLNERYLIADLVSKEINIRKFVSLGAGYNFKNSASCMQCPIRNVCPTMCVGAVDEYWGGAMSTPIPSVCAYYLLKYTALAKRFPEWKSDEVDYKTATEQCNKYFGSEVYNIILKTWSQQNV